MRLFALIFLLALSVLPASAQTASGTFVATSR